MSFGMRTLACGFTRIWRHNGANVAMMFALMLLPLIGMVGMAVDSARGYSVKMRLQEAIDSAALVGARNLNDPHRDQMIQDYFAANWRASFMDTNTPTLTISQDMANQSITLQAVTTMPTVFMWAFGTPSVTVGTLTSSVTGETFLEVALALDNTSSMRTLNSGVRRIDAMKTAASNFLDVIYTENGSVQDTIGNMWVSVIPFTSMVNIGPQHTNFLAAGSTNNLQWDFPKNTTTQNSWRGCVFERSFYNEGAYGGRDMTDDSPAAEPFYPYHVPMTQVEAATICRASPYVPPVPVPVPPVPPPPCTEDGNTCKVSFAPIKPPEANTSNFLKIAAADGCRSDYNFPAYSSVNKLYRPALSYQTARGIVVQYPSADGVTSLSYHATLPAGSPFNDNSFYASKNVSGLSACCHAEDPAYNQYDGFFLLPFTNIARWIAPWPNAVSPVLGGWGNSGCGVPVRPLVASRATVWATINAMDVPPVAPVGSPPLGYEGTLINEGLVWGWRAISPNYRGYWREPNGSTIDSTLPRDYGTLGGSKAVVVMTDGLNFMPDRLAISSGVTPQFTPNRNSYFLEQNYSISFTGETNLSPSSFTIGGANVNVLAAVDSSAYGILRPDTDRTVYTTIGSTSNALSFCRQRQAGGKEPYLATWGCREYDCMLRDVSGSCVRSSSGPGVYDLQSALTGPYYDELTRRLLVTCANMRAHNIRIFFVLFDIAANPQRAAALAAFNTCVGNLGAVYNADNPTELNQAFQAIAGRLRQLRLSQ